VYTVFDDESDGQSTLYSSSRAVTISLDLATDTASAGLSQALMHSHAPNAPDGQNTSDRAGLGAVKVITNLSELPTAPD